MEGDIIVPVFQSTGALVLWLAATVLMPIVIGLITKPSTPAKYQAALLLAASAANGILSEALAAGSTYNWGKAIMQAVVALVIAGAAHFNVWRPSGATAAALRVGSRQNVGRQAA